MAKKPGRNDEPSGDVEELRRQLLEAQETLQAIRNGDVDALITKGPAGNQVFTLESADRPYRLFIEEMQQGAVTLNSTGIILYHNRRFAEIVRRHDGELLGKPFHDLVAPVSRSAFLKMLGEAAAGRVADELELMTATQSLIPTFLAINPFPAEGAAAFCVVVSDLTEQKQHENLVAATNALRQSETRFRSVLESSRDLIYRLNVQTGRFEYISPSCERVVGYSVEEWSAMTSQTTLALIHPEDLPAMQAVLSRLEDKGEGELEYRQRTNDGCYRWISNRMSLSRDSAGRPLYRNGIIRDITERRQAEEALAAAHGQVKSIIDNTTSIVYAFDLEERFLMANAALARLLKVAPEQMVGKRRHQFMPKEDADWHEANDRRVIETGRALEFEERSQLEDRSITWLTTKFPLRDARGRIYAVAGISADVSERKRAEETLNAAKTEADRANKAKDEFLAILSHELRTPLTSMLGWVRMLQTQELDQIAVKKGLDVIERSVRTQARIVEDLLEVSRIVTGKMVIEKLPVDLAAVVSEIAADYQSVAESRKQTLLCRHPETLLVDGDKSRLRQVVWNLLSNAVKFTPVGGRIDVTLQVDDDQAVLTVSDTGRGISSDFLPHLFQRFRQEDTGSGRRYMGLGLGLALTSSIVQLHDGSITARSAGEGKGTTMTVKIPVLVRLPEPTGARATDKLADQPLRGVKVLVVDDDQDVRELLAAAFKIAGAEVVTADSTSEALVLYGRFQPAVLVSDIGMPVEDGCVLIQKLRVIERQEGRKPMPAIALTGYAQPEDAERARVAGYDIHVAKPVEPDVLIRAVAKLQKPMS